MFQASQIWSKLIERPQAKTSPLRLDYLTTTASLVKQANAMISKSLGKLHKVRAQGEDNQGNTYADLESMWRSQLDPVYIEANGGDRANASEETKQAAPAGGKQAWYKG